MTALRVRSTEKRYKPSCCGACKYSKIDTSKGIEFTCLKANREIPGTSDTIARWCPLYVEVQDGT